MLIGKSAADVFSAKARDLVPRMSNSCINFDKSQYLISNDSVLPYRIEPGPWPYQILEGLIASILHNAAIVGKVEVPFSIGLMDVPPGNNSFKFATLQAMIFKNFFVKSFKLMINKNISPQIIAENVKENIQNGYHPEGCYTIKSLLDHEFGHIFYFSNRHKLKNLRNTFLFSSLFLSYKIFSRISSTNKYFIRKLIVSKYAVENYDPNEFFAEHYSHFLNGCYPLSYGTKEVMKKFGLYVSNRPNNRKH